MRVRARNVAVSVLILLLLLAGGTAWFVTRVPGTALDGQQAANTPALAEQGRYVARLADCVACHSTPDGAPFAGGLEMNTPLGAIFTTNITPDKTTGIGTYTLADFARAVRQGVTPDGRRLYPAMPYPSYTKLSDDDVRALYAYFMTAVAPVQQPDQASTIPWPMNMRWPLALWSAVFTSPGRYQPDGAKDALWNRGAYLVEGPGHCGSCHTPRGLAFNELALDGSSPKYLSGGLLDGWYAPSLRGGDNPGLGTWSEDDVFAFLKAGRNAHEVVFGSMTDAYNNSTQFMSDDDLHAIAHYLKSLPPGPAAGTPWTYDPATNQKLTLAALTQTPGAQTYMDKCSYCHGADGRGQAPWIPPLAGASAMLEADPSSAINITLNGSGRVVAAGLPDAYRMPPYRAQLSNQQIADLLTFLRQGWGNQGGAVSAAQVQALAQHTDPASSSVIILEMR